MSPNPRRRSTRLCFGSLAEHVAASLQKGDRVGVVGKGEVETWTGKDGVERHKKEILADGVGPDLRFVKVGVNRRQPAQQGMDEEPF
ncbi:MAG TPA: single-stranded DNA-binding protein [Acidimicrobiales bacterium]